MEPVALQRTFLLVAWTAPQSPFAKPPTGDLLKPFPFAGRYGFTLLPYSPRCPLRLSTCFRAQLLDPVAGRPFNSSGGHHIKFIATPPLAGD